ncbi:cupin domain-containing protein [Oxalobacteraceae bacterium A2-2]
MDTPEITAITAFSRQSPAPQYDHPREERRLAGNPRRTTWNHYSSASGDVSAGVWACEPGSWRIAFGPHKDEYFYVLEGRCRVIDEQGAATEAGPGDALVIPAGFKGVFEVVEAIRKHYVIIDRPA